MVRLPYRLPRRLPGPDDPLMDSMTRRRFLRASGVIGAGALVAGAAGFGIGELLSKATPEAREEAAKRSKLVIITLYGGNDGLNTVIPYADPLYYKARPELAYKQERVLRLDTALALNPMLPGLHRLWQSKRLAVVAGVGYPHPDRSHFRSMDIWQTANPVRPIRTGWVGRWLDGTAAPVEAAVSFESVLPPLLVGETRSGACISVGGLTLPSGLTTAMIGTIGQPQTGEPDLQARAAVSYADLVKMDTMVRDASSADSSPTAGADHLPGTATGGASSLAAQLALVTRCVEAGVPTSVYSVSLGGFDTHAEERAGHEMLLRELDTALSSFVDRMASSPAGQKVSVLVYSEFGRRVRANASDGTDHGTAGPVFVLGPGVAGGLYGEQPSLKNLDDGDLKATVDFRDVLGSALSTVLAAEPARYLDGYQPTLLPIFPTA
jgi:uncharacterized protein (DUF1501 family)